MKPMKIHLKTHKIKTHKIGPKLGFITILSQQTPIIESKHIGGDVRCWKPVQVFTLFEL